MVSITIEKDGKKKEFKNLSQVDIEFIYETLLLDKDISETNTILKASNRTIMKVLDFKEGILC